MLVWQESLRQVIEEKLEAVRKVSELEVSCETENFVYLA